MHNCTFQLYICRCTQPLNNVFNCSSSFMHIARFLLKIITNNCHPKQYFTAWNALSFIAERCSQLWRVRCQMWSCVPFKWLHSIPLVRTIGFHKHKKQKTKKLKHAHNKISPSELTLQSTQFFFFLRFFFSFSHTRQSGITPSCRHNSNEIHRQSEHIKNGQTSACRFVERFSMYRMTFIKAFPRDTFR